MGRVGKMITSTANAQVKQLIQLHKKAKIRNAQDVFVVEGMKMFREAPRDRIAKAYVSSSFYEEAERRTLLEGLSYEVVEDQVFRAMSDTQTPQGVLCILRQYHYGLEELLGKTGSPKSGEPSPLLLVLENLQDPGNLGTILRTAEGAGVTGVILNRGSVDIYNPKTIRSTMGSIYRVPFLYAEDLQEILGILRQRGIRSFAAHLKGADFYDQENYQGGTAFLIGNESNGLSQELSDFADAYIRIPMEGQLESLNAAVSAAILMYEAYRQRR